MREREEGTLREKIRKLLAEPPSSVPVSPAILRLEAEKNQALEEENYLRSRKSN